MQTDSLKGVGAVGKAEMKSAGIALRVNTGDVEGLVAEVVDQTSVVARQADLQEEGFVAQLVACPDGTATAEGRCSQPTIVEQSGPTGIG